MDVSRAQIMGGIVVAVVILGLYMLSVKKELSNS